MKQDLGMVTAYAYAKAGGYTGTEAQFEEMLGSLSDTVDELSHISATASGLPAGSNPTASYSNGVISFGIPKGDKGDTGSTGPTGPAGAAGADYVLTSADKVEIRDAVYALITAAEGGNY